MPSPRLVGCALLLLLSLTVPAFAYNLNGGARWADGSTTFYSGIAGTSTSGTQWSAALESALQLWSDKTAFKFVANRTSVDPCTGYTRSSGGTGHPAGNGDVKNSADFSATVCGNDFGSGVLAVTYWRTTSGSFGFDYIAEADIAFNAASYTWDVYSGKRKSGVVDFGRVALHELGHVLGLDHESTADAIMAPRISDLYQLQTDDIAGANALYAPQTTCVFNDISLNGVARNSLDAKDCRIKDFFGSGSDDSPVDVYKIKLTNKLTRLVADMRSSQLDSVIVLTDDKLRMIDIFESTATNCTAHMDKSLSAGTYLILANTYTQPKKCGTNTGSYTLSVSDGSQPILGDAGATGGGTAAAALFTGGATADGGTTYKSTFASTDTIDVNAAINVDPAHVGQIGKVFVLVQASNGASFSKNANGEFVPFAGNLAQLVAYKSGALATQEPITVVKGLKAASMAGLSFVVYVGYALDSQSGTIHYGNDPIRFSISP